MAAPFSLDALLDLGSGNVVMQKRTGPLKQFVVSVGGDEAVVVKGPWWHDVCSHVRDLDIVLARYNLFALWQTPFVVQPRGTIQEYRSDRPVGTYLLFDDFARDYRPLLAVTTWQESPTFRARQRTYNVATERVGVVKLSAVKTATPPAWLLAAVPRLLLAFVHLFLANVGDVHFANVLVDLDRQALYVVDIDETRRNDPTTVTPFYFTKPMAKATYDDWWRDAARSAAPWIVDQVNALDLTALPPDYDARRRQAIELLLGDVLGLGGGGSADTDTVPSRPRKRQKLLTESPSPPVTAAAVAATVPTQLSDLDVALLDADVRDALATLPHATLPLTAAAAATYATATGYMLSQGRCTAFTFSGVPFDVLKSLLQKAIRRGHVLQAVWAAIEGYRMAEVDRGVRDQTNVYTRLAVTAAEDVDVADPRIAEFVIRKCLAARNAKGRLLRNAETMAAMAHALASARKSRLPSHMYNSYVIPRAVAYARRMHDVQWTDAVAPWPDAERLWLESFGGGCVRGRRSGVAFAQALFGGATANEAAAVVWMERHVHDIVDAAEAVHADPKKFWRSGLAPADRDRHAFVWKVLGHGGRVARPLLTTLRHAYETIGERRPFIMFAVAMATRRPYAPFDTMPDDASRVADWRRSLLLHQALQGVYPDGSGLRVPLYAIDQHTAIGRSKAVASRTLRCGVVVPLRDRNQFVREGAVVANEAAEFVDPVLADTYVNGLGG
jgi:hypothetical protein